MSIFTSLGMHKRTSTNLIKSFVTKNPGDSREEKNFCKSIECEEGICVHLLE